MIELLNHSLEKLVPQFKRARGYRLYAEDGKRYSDFFQGAGFQLLGHRVNKEGLWFKTSLGKGLGSLRSSVALRRLGTMLAKLWPSEAVLYVFPHQQAFLKAWQETFKKSPPLKDLQWLFPNLGKSHLAWGSAKWPIWKPFFKEPSGSSCILQIPTPQFLSSFVVCLKGSSDPFKGIREEFFSFSYPVALSREHPLGGRETGTTDALQVFLSRALSGLEANLLAYQVGQFLSFTQFFQKQEPYYQIWDKHPLFRRYQVYLYPRYGKKTSRRDLSAFFGSGVCVKSRLSSS